MKIAALIALVIAARLGARQVLRWVEEYEAGEFEDNTYAARAADPTYGHRG
jgi:hypothetical protein